MTVIKFKDRPVWHQTGAKSPDGRDILIAEQPRAILIREKGRRDVLELPYERAYLRAAELKAAAGKPQRRRRTVCRGAFA